MVMLLALAPDFADDDDDDDDEEPPDPARAVKKDVFPLPDGLISNIICPFGILPDVKCK